MFSVFLMLTAAANPLCGTETAQPCITAPEDLRMNDIVAVGTHNSYKERIARDVMAEMLRLRGEEVLALDYAHRPITEQLNAGVRQLEIDVYHDPEGGRFARPLGVNGKGNQTDAGFIRDMRQSGFKVMHIPDIDFRSSCLRLVQCLTEIKTWSDANPGHVPLLILINSKQGEAALPGGTAPLPFTADAFDALDAEIRAILSDKLITPDRVQGNAPTLREAVRTQGWPALADMRGRIFFALDERPEVVATYRGSRKSLEGRVMFVNSDEASPASAYITLNDPVKQQERIKAAVRAGIIVRTRADDNTWAARRNDKTQSEAAFTSGAHYISTDYIWPDPMLGNGYQVRLPGGNAAICNAVRLNGQCDGQPVERRDQK